MSVGNANPFMGYGSAIGVAEESTFGTFVTATAFIEFNSESLKQNREESKLPSINTTRSYKKRLIMNETVEGSIEFDADPNSDAQAYIIKQAMGGTVTSDSITAAGGYTHTFYTGDMESNQSTSGAADAKSLSISVRRGDTSTSSNVFAYSGVRVNTLSIKGEVGTPVIITAEIMGKTMSITGTLPTVSLSDQLPLNFTGVTIKTGATITTVSTEYFTGFEFTLNNNMNTDVRSLGSRTVDKLPPQMRDVALTLSQRFDTTTAYDRFIGNTMTAIEIECTGATIGAVATSYALIIKIPAGYYNSNMPEVGGADVLTHEINVTGMYGSAAAYDVQMQMRNATANY